MQPRLIRKKYVPEYFGVSRGKFDKDFRPYLTEIPLGDKPQSGVVYDRYELDALADIIKERNGRPAKKGDKAWDANQKALALRSSRDEGLPTCISKAPSTEEELDAVLEQTMKQPQK